MIRFDPIAIAALVFAATALYAALRRRREPKRLAAPAAGPDLHFGDIEIEPLGMGACRIARKSPDPIRVRDGDWVIWRVRNHCEQEAVLEVVERRRGPGNSTQHDNPLNAVFNPAIPGKDRDGTPGTGEVTWLVKREADLSPSPHVRSDKWSFRWRLNHAMQNDPEIEIEYRRAH
jgi:hypothetical protein